MVRDVAVTLNKILILLFVGVLLSARPTPALAVDVDLEITPMLAGQPFALLQETEAPSDDYVFQVTLLRYYVSSIFLIHDGGQRTSCSDVFLLVNAAGNTTFQLGNYDVDRIEGVEFGLGVNQIYNHLDPSTYPASHPLAHQNPSMHWGWTTGYRFCTFEGKAAQVNSSRGAVFQIHSVGDELFKIIRINVGAEVKEGRRTIPLIADYAALLTDLNVTLGTITHGNYGEAITLQENFQKHVFKAGVVSSVEEQTNVLPLLSIHPHPVRDQLTINVSAEDMMRDGTNDRAKRDRCSDRVPNANMVRVCDPSGQDVVLQRLGEGTNTIDVSQLPAGLYAVTVVLGDGTVVRRPFVKTD